MLEWLKRRQRPEKTTPDPASPQDREQPRLMADGTPSRYVDPHRFAGSPPLHLDPYGPGNLTLCEDAPVAAYIAKGHARRFARLLASGEPLRVHRHTRHRTRRALRGHRARGGHPDLVEHLLSPRSTGLPAPRTD